MAKPIHTARHRRLREIIKTRRIELGLTQAAVARSLGRHQPFVANIESGERRLDVIEFLALTDILDLDPAATISILQAVTDGRKSRSPRS